MRLTITLFFCILSICFFFPSPLDAQKDPSNTAVAPELIQEMKYRSIGPMRGGRATAITGIPEKPYTFFMGSTGGGVWKTTDAGTSWKNISDGYIKVGSVGAIAVAPSDDHIIYVGTGSASPRGNISPGDGVYKSMDGGKTWTHSGLPKAGQIGGIAIHPKNPDLVYVAALGNIFGPNPERGVYQSKDGGETWEQILFVSEKTGAVELKMDPNNPRILYAGMWTAERKPWTLIDGSDETGVYKTTNGGKTWNRVEGGLPTGVLGRIGIAISPANSDRIWVIQQAAEEKKGGVYRSDDGGKNWERINRNHKLRQRGWYYSHIFAHPTDENTVFALNTGFYRSTDGGKTFSDRISVPHGDNHGLWINPNQPNIMINCNDGGANVSLNAGKTWSAQTNQPTAEFYRVTVDQQFPYRVYGGQQDNTTLSVPSRGVGGVSPFQEWYAVGGGESGDVAVDPRDPNIIWAGTYSGEITRKDRRTNHTRQTTAWPHYTEGWEQRDLKYRFHWNFPIRISPHNPDEVYHTSNYVHRTTDGGQTWDVISPDLTQAIDAYHDIPGGPVQHDGTGVEIYSTIFAFEISPHEPGVLWAGSDDGLVHISQDSGKSWQNITPDKMPKEGTVNMIALSDHSAGRAFIAVYKYRDNDFSPYIFRTDNYGKSWDLLTNGKNGIPEGTWVRAVREDPDRKGLLYAGTEFGMYVSLDDGQHWQDFQLNLPHTPVTDLEVHEQDLVLSTQGRSFWILDDLTPLHQISDEVARSDQFLFKPRATYRTQLGGTRGLPPAPSGATVFFYLKEKPGEKENIRLEILDQNDQLIQTWTPKPVKSRREKKLELKVGMNRLNWNLRYPGPTLVKDLVAMVIRNPAPGPVAAPGTYKVRLSIGDWTQTQAFDIKKDPRWAAISNQDLAEQFALAQKVSKIISHSHHMIKELRSIRKQAASIASLAVKAGHDRELIILADSINLKTTALEDKLIQNKIETSQDAINYPRKFTNHIGRLYGVLNGLDSKPTGGVLTRFEELKTEFQGYVDQYDRLMDHDLKIFNERLKQEQVNSVILLPFKD